MDKVERIIILGAHILLYIVAGIVIELVITWLFPYTGLAAIICLPAIVIFSLVFGSLLYKTRKTQLKKCSLSLIFIASIIIQLLFQLWITPQDFGGSTFSKIADSFNAYRRYDQIQFTQFLDLTRMERVAFIYKFKDKLPDSYITLSIDSVKEGYDRVSPETYIITTTKGSRYYDTNRLKIIESDSATIIIENPNAIDCKIYKMNRNFLNLGAGGFSGKEIVLNVHEDDLNLDTGIEKLLFLILHYTKSPE